MKTNENDLYRDALSLLMWMKPVTHLRNVHCETEYLSDFFSIILGSCWEFILCIWKYAWNIVDIRTDWKQEEADRSACWELWRWLAGGWLHINVIVWNHLKVLGPVMLNTMKYELKSFPRAAYYNVDSTIKSPSGARFCFWLETQTDKHL